MIIEGSLAVKAALLNRKRVINNLFIDKSKKDKDTNFIIKKAREFNIEVVRLDREIIDEMASGKTHGGIIAEVSYREFELINKEARTIFYIDGIEDPFNLGYIFRTLKAFGYEDIIMNKRDLRNMENTILKSSAGAFDMLNIEMSDDIISLLISLKKTHKILALYRNDKAYDLFKYEFPSNKVVILGGEKRGINREVMNLVDDEIFIPYDSDFRAALNASSALAVIASIMKSKE